MPSLRRSAPLVSLGVLALSALAACSTVPYSERSRVILLSESQERELGQESYTQILAEQKLSADAEQAALLERVGRRIARVADKRLAEAEREPFEWEFKLIDAPETVNAFALPGGKVAFFSGILPICKDELGIAVVMGHEVAHALARHGGERVSQQVVLNLGISVLSALASSDPGVQSVVAQALGVGAGVAFVLPFSRDHESEADYIGLLMMAEAGYDPRAAPRFWERMKALKDEQGDGPGFEFLSTHPSDDTRIQALEANMDEAREYYERATGERLDPHRHVLTSEH